MWVFPVSWLWSLCYLLCTAKRDLSKKPDLEQVGMEWRRPRLGCAIPPPSPPRETDRRRRRANAVRRRRRHARARGGSDFAYERDDRVSLVGGANACLMPRRYTADIDAEFTALRFPLFAIFCWMNFGIFCWLVGQYCTGISARMSYRKWRENKQHLI